MATYYFAYGADMDPAELDLQQDRRRRPRLHFAKSTPGTLQGYRLLTAIPSKHRRGGIFNVLEDPMGTVHGVVYELHPGDTLSIAALKEGEAADYSLSLLPVKVKGGESLSALVLHAKEETKTLVPAASYLEIVIKAAQKHRLPAEWVQQLVTLRHP